jgi:hypothetical protein
MRRAVCVALALLAGVTVSDQVLYARLLVPRLPQLHSVPMLVWLAVTSPIWLAGLASGMSLRSWRDTALGAFVAAIAVQSYETWAAHSGQLGFAKSWAIEDPAFFWTGHLGELTAAVLALLMMGRLIRLAIPRPAASLTSPVQTPENFFRGAGR